MKTLRLLTLALFLPLLALPATTFAAKPGKGGKGGKGAGKALKSYDANGDGKIDGAEIEAVRSAFVADKEGALKNLDKDADGKLSDEEITSAKVKTKEKKKKAA